ncbi:MAG: prephenate dehydratase domain-containing protein [Alphaproteobacteria bacterium]
MSKRNLFVSFAESDGGHSYLAMRSMLDANSIGHLLFRTTVADVLDTVIAGQANFAVVPFYNSITHWDGATVKALASGQFEIHAQMCMPVSYVLAAHKQYMSEFVERYRALSPRDEGKAELSAERAKKIYTRFLTRIFVNAQAEEQYRGRLIRPDMAQATLEHTRNPLRVLEEISRNELVKDLQWGAPRHARPQREQGFGGTPFFVELAGARPGTISELNVPAVLIASGLLDARQDNDGWDRHGSVGEILSLLKNLLELLDVYSFGAPDMPENKTKYLLLSKKGTKLPQGALLPLPEKSQSRTMVLVRTNHRVSTADQWRRPLERLEKRAETTDYVFDRAPVPVEGTGHPVFLFEGGKARPSGIKAVWQWPTLFGSKPGPSSLQEKIERKPEPKPDKGSADDHALFYLGEYKSWCAPSMAHPEGCSCAVTPVASEDHGSGSSATPLLAFGLGVAAASVLLLGGYFLMGSGSSQTGTGSYQPPAMTAPPAAAIPPSGTIGTTGSEPASGAYPGLPGSPPKVTPAAPSATSGPIPPYPASPVAITGDRTPSIGNTPAAPANPAMAQPRPVLMHVAFAEAKSNLTRESFNVLASAASQSLQSNREVSIRIFAIGQREADAGLWRRRLNAVRDELVRLGVPVARIRSEGTGPFMLRIQKPQAQGAQRRAPTYDGAYDQRSLDDPFSNE